MKTVGKYLTRVCIGIVPIRFLRHILQSAALASPKAKTEIFQRICAHVAQIVFPRSQEILETNLGISPSLRCKLPIAKDGYVFGRPENLISERATIVLASELCQDCADFLDVGANDGIFTFMVNYKAGSSLRLHWFEPDQRLWNRLQTNLAANSIVAAGSRAAIAAENGTATFFSNLTDDSLGSLTDAPLHMTVAEPVETMSLASYFHAHGIHDALVKVDVEGAGEAVWRGAREIAPEIRYLIMEMIAPEMQCELPAKIISEGRFHAYYIKDFELTVFRNNDFLYVAPFWNWLFCRLDPEALRARLTGTRFRVVETRSAPDGMTV